MMHDIAHCSQSKCPKKGTCYRYLAHLEAQDKKLSYISYFVTDRMPIDGSCDMYWECKNQKE